MALSRYKQKRDLNKSPEPVGGKASGNKLRFVVQKHDARRLHYDFRLEMDGVLKSWAVPKGPSTNPSDKRLAVMVEDHPYDYRNFEGVIPEGYGAGTVIVWDEGFYEPIETSVKGKKQQEKFLLKQLKAGMLKVLLHGQKLKGEFVLVKTPATGENNWLLIKHKDDFAAKSDVTKKGRSVLSDQTISQVEKEGKRLLNLNDSINDKVNTVSKQTVARKLKRGITKNKAAIAAKKAGKTLKKKPLRKV
jgi:bifunctional non-homologous end joining protein LigD